MTLDGWIIVALVGAALYAAFKAPAPSAEVRSLDEARPEAEQAA